MAEELVKTDNGTGAPHEPAKKAARKPQESGGEQDGRNKGPRSSRSGGREDRAGGDGGRRSRRRWQPPPAAAEAAAAEVKAPTNGSQPAGINKIVKDATAQVDKLPGTKQVREAVSKVADQVGSNEVTQKAVRRVRDTADQVKMGAQDLEKNPLVIAAHKVLLAGIGAAALAQEEIEDFINRLVERGSIAESDGKRMAKDVLDQRRKQMERAGEKAQEVAADMRTSVTEGPKKLADDLEQRIESVLARMNIPTKEEVETLTSKITALTHKVDELKKTE